MWCLTIHGDELHLPLSRALPLYLQRCPHYHRLPRRVSRYINFRRGTLNCIDISANAKDTLAAFQTYDTDTFLAIKPHPKYDQLLARNWGWNRRVTVVSPLCTSHHEMRTYKIREKSGTASVVECPSGVALNATTLDRLLKDYPYAGSVNGLKGDTDGHDLQVPHGARSLLERERPIVLFECDALGNEAYADKGFTILGQFRESGYGGFLVYDNLGYLLGTFSFADLSIFKNLLLYRSIRPFMYFDHW